MRHWLFTLNIKTVIHPPTPQYKLGEGMIRSDASRLQTDTCSRRARCLMIHIAKVRKTASRVCTQYAPILVATQRLTTCSRQQRVPWLLTSCTRQVHIPRMGDPHQTPKSGMGGLTELRPEDKKIPLPPARYHDDVEWLPVAGNNSKCCTPSRCLPTTWPKSSKSPEAAFILTAVTACLLLNIDVTHPTDRS